MTNDHENDKVANTETGSKPAGQVDQRTSLPSEITSHMNDLAQPRGIYNGHDVYDYTDGDEVYERRAQLLKVALGAVGVESNVHWDRSPWGVRIGLVPGEYRDPTYEQPSLFVLTEGRKNISGQWAWEWDLCLGNFGEYGNGRFDDLAGKILERTWLGEDVNKSAQIIKDYVLLLTTGALATHAQQLADDQEGGHA